MRFPGFIGPSYTLISKNVDCQRCINLYPEINESGKGKEGEVASFVSTPGSELLNEVGDGPMRGAWTATNGQLFVVSGDTVYRLDSDFEETEIGTLNSSTGAVGMADNGTSLVIVDGTDGYVVTLSNGAFAEITDPDFPGATQVFYQDGYFIFIKPDSGQFFISSLNGTDFDALDIATSEGNPDNIIAGISVNREVWLFNAITTEVFYNSGNADFPFERVQGAFVEQGCAARGSVVRVGTSVCWLGRNDKGTGIVYRANGYNPQRISTHAVELAIQGYGDISDAVAYSYQQNGHDFYVLNFSSANTTWVYDLSTGQWHERTYTSDGAQSRHRGNCYAFAYDTHVIGDFENGKIYQLSHDVYTDDGAVITRQRVAPHVTSGLRRIFYNSFQLDIETGTGLDGTGQGTDPKVILQFSDDGGHSWSNEKWADIGKIGRRSTRVVWRRLGMSRDRVFRITITDPVKITIIGAEIDVSQGAA